MQLKSQITLIFTSILAFLTLMGCDELEVRWDDTYGKLFVESYLENEMKVKIDPEYTEFCFHNGYEATKDNKYYTPEGKITFAQCNGIECIANTQSTFLTIDGKLYHIDIDRRNLNIGRKSGDPVISCVRDMDRIYFSKSNYNNSFSRSSIIINFEK